MSRNNILFVIDGEEFGGGERVFIQLMSKLNDRYNIYVASLPGGRFEEEVNSLGVVFIPVDSNIKFSIKTIIQLIRIIKNKKISILNSQGARADFFARVACRLSGSPSLICTIAMPVEGFDVGIIKKNLYRFMDYITERYVDRFIVVSNTLKDMLTDKREIDEDKVDLIYNGIELDHYHPEEKSLNLRKEFDIPVDIPLIGAVGRMVWQKGFEYLIRGIPEIVKKVPDAKFVFVGEGPLRSELEDLTKKIHVEEKVVFTGYRNDIRGVLSTIDLLVVPSLLEGFPLIILEAMAMAKPIVATRINGIIEQIQNNNNGILVPKQNSDELAKAVISCLHNENRSNEMGNAARKIVEKKFSVEKMVSETEKIYSSLRN